MKTYLLLPLLSLALVGCSQKDDSASLTDKAKDTAVAAADQTKAAAKEVKDAVTDKLTEWKLTPADIKADLAKGGSIVRSRAAAAGETIGDIADDARIVTLINGKYVADSDLSALKINVDASKGIVTLKGTVASPDLIGRAILLALDTKGVNQVISLLAVESK